MSYISARKIDPELIDQIHRIKLFTSNVDLVSLQTNWSAQAWLQLVRGNMARIWIVFFSLAFPIWMESPHPLPLVK